MESLYFLIPLFFIIIFSLPLSIKLKVCLNKNNDIILSLFLFKIRLILVRVSFINGKLFLFINKNKKEIELFLSQKQIYFVDHLTKNVLQKMQLKKVGVFFRYGNFDAYKTAMICGFINSVENIVFSYLKNYRQTCSFDKKTYYAFNKDVFCFASYISFSISTFDIIYSLIVSLFTLKGVKYGRTKSKFS